MLSGITRGLAVSRPRSDMSLMRCRALMGELEALLLSARCLARDALFAATLGWWCEPRFVCHAQLFRDHRTRLARRTLISAMRESFAERRCELLKARREAEGGVREHRLLHRRVAIAILVVQALGTRDHLPQARWRERLVRHRARVAL